MFCCGRFIIFYFILPIVDSLEDQRGWINAYRHCQSQRKVLTPIASISLQRNRYRTDVSLWTPNYVIDLGCPRNIGLYVEQLSVNTVNRALCMKNDSTIVLLKTPYKYSNADLSCAWEHSGPHNHPDSLMNITNVMLLTNVMDKMEMNYKYWIGGIGPDISGLDKQCEVYHQMSNTTTASTSRIYMTSCHRLHRFNCVTGFEETGHRTAISLIQLSKDHESGYGPHTKENQQNPETHSAIRRSGTVTAAEHQHQDTTFLPYLSITISVLVLIGIIVSVYLIRRWMSQLQVQMQTLQEHHRYTQPMYANEPLQLIHEDVMFEPETPISYTGSSIYANRTMSNGTNITVSYLTSTQVQHCVGVNGIQRSVSDDNNGGSTSINVPSTQRPRPFKGKSLRLSATGYKPHDQRRLLNNRQISTEPASSRLCPFPENLIVMENEWLRNEEPVHNTSIEIEQTPDFAKNKPSPKPFVKFKTVAAKHHHGQLVQSKSGPEIYTNSASGVSVDQENKIDDELGDYENIWQT